MLGQQRLDASGDQGEFGVGLAGGPLQKVYEIKDVLQRARLAWVQSVRITPNDTFGAVRASDDSALN